MGMFDYVDVGGAVDCPYCDKPITTKWQSKDGDCMMDTVHWTKVWDFYTNCPHCMAWVEYRRVLPHPATPRFEGYALVGSATP